MALTSRDSLLKALYGVDLSPEAKTAVTGTTAPISGRTATTATASPDTRVPNPAPSYTNPRYGAAPLPETPPKPPAQPPVTVVNNLPPSSPLIGASNAPVNEDQLLAQWKARFDANGNLIPGTGPEFNAATNSMIGGTPPAGGGAGADQGIQYYNPDGSPYNGGPTAYWFNSAEGKWYSGDKATNAITPLGSVAPWNTPPGGQNQQNIPGAGAGGAGTPGAPMYYGPGGGKYDPATDATSYWYNAAEGQWYQGDTATGKISVAPGGPPWMDLTTDPRLSGLIDKMSSMPYDKDYVNLMGGKYNEQIQANAGTAREELANRLGAAGVFGGNAQSQLRGVDAASALGLSQGLGNIYNTAMGNAYEDRRAALNALQGKEWQNLQKLLGTSNQELAMEQLNQSGMFRTQEDQVNLALTLLQMAQNASGNDQQMLYALATQLLNGGGSSILQGGV